VASARIVLVAMPRMLRDLIAGVVESQTDMQLVEPGGDAPDTIEVSRPVVRPRPRAGTDPSPA